MQVSILGTGLMGSPMAIRLRRAGYPLTVWNRTSGKTAPAVEAGARFAATAAEAVAGADVVLVILENGPVVERVLFEDGVAGALAPGAVLVDMSSISPEAARLHHDRLAALGVAHLDAPVSGGPGGAEDGTLAIMVGGEEATFAKARDLLGVMGRPTLVGPPGSGQLAKLCSQILSATAIGALSEVFVLARRYGADPAMVRQALRGGFAESRVLEVHGDRMLRRDFEPGGHVRTFVKDLRTAMTIAQGQNLSLPLAELAYDLFARFERSGGGDSDISGLLQQTEGGSVPSL
ncbi:NAD(P)-dependent oxidoreductase [Methylobacterium terricola]|nr:NAD(P)-dependent oxidoreductase [Methylobacterium terricola]